MYEFAFSILSMFPFNSNMSHSASDCNFKFFNKKFIIYYVFFKVATAPNAIVFMHSTMKTSDMMKTGFLLNIICILTTNTAINTWGDFLFGLDEYPAWAASAAQDCNVTSFVTAQNVVFPTNITQSLPSPISG